LDHGGKQKRFYGATRTYNRYYRWKPHHTDRNEWDLELKWN
jgi:hypothetical protein